jgi:hypothetical protein
MRCGNCKGEHDTVDDVRTCSGLRPRETAHDRVLRHSHGLQAKSTHKQLSLAHALGRERERLAEYKELEKAEYEEMINSLGFADASSFISRMLKQPYVRGAQAGYAGWDDKFLSIKPGKYALQSEDETIRFYQVHRLMDDGRGNRRMDVSELTGAPGDFRRRRLLRVYKILSAIHENPTEAFALFGQKVGQCGVCSSPLTNERTRERGIGDICYDKLTGGS